MKPPPDLTPDPGKAPEIPNPADTKKKAPTGLMAVVFWIGHTTERFLDWIRVSIARGIIWARIPPNAVTLAGPFALAVVFIPILNGDLWIAAWIVLLGGAFDTFDGAVARLSGGATRFGAYLDSVVDRYADLLLLFALLAWLLVHGQGPRTTVYLVLWCLSVVGTVATSYAKARAEKLIPNLVAGYLERPERTVAVVLGLLSGHLHSALWVIAVFSNLIAIQRICLTRATLEGRTSVSPFLYWTYGRGSAEHTLLSMVLISVVIFGGLVIPAP